MSLLSEAAYFIGTSFRRKDQHFLINEGIISKEASYASLSKGDVALEIGGGLGFLTRELAKHCAVVVVENDVRLLPALRRTGAQVVHGDALKVPFPRFTKFVSNIPYSISLPLTLKLLRSDFSTGVLIVQKEFAQKLTAKPGDAAYGRASALAQYYADIEIKDKVFKHDFLPKPKVDSRIVVFRKKRPVNAGYEEFATTLFRQRRKKVPGMDKRPEQLSVSELIALYEAKK